MAGLSISLLYHFLCFGAYAYTLYFDLMFIRIPSRESPSKACGGLTVLEDFISRLKFLTFWNLCVHVIYFGLSFSTDLMVSRPHDVPFPRSILEKIRDKIHAGIAFPLAAFVFTTFWGLYAVDRELVYPTFLDKYIPVWWNHAAHTFVLPSMLMDKFFTFHLYPSRATGLGLAFGVSIIYLVMTFYIGIVHNIWVYGILEVMPWSFRIAFTVALLTLLALLYLIGERLTRIAWRKMIRVKRA